METMAGLERFRGHFYNWYDTLTLLPLRPAYVSTVDSGNLAGHLLALRVGLEEVAEGPLIGAQTLAGLADTVHLTLEEVRDAREHVGAAGDEARIRLDELRRRAALPEPPATLEAWSALISELERSAEGLPERLGAAEGDEAERAARAVGAVSTRIRRLRTLLTQVAPWAPLISRTPEAVKRDPRFADVAPLLESVPSLLTLAEGLDAPLAALASLESDPPGVLPGSAESALWAHDVASELRAGAAASTEVLARLRLLQSMATEMWEHTDFRMLYDRGRELFSIGFNTEQGRCDDVLLRHARERVPTGELPRRRAAATCPQEHWFRLGRMLTRTRRWLRAALVVGARCSST